MLAFTGHEVPWIFTVVAFFGGSRLGDRVPDLPGDASGSRGREGPAVAAVSLSSAQFNLGRVIGPALAGIALVAGSAGWAFAANAISFGAVVVALLLVKLPAREPYSGRRDRRAD